jgi:surface protein
MRMKNKILFGIIFMMLCVIASFAAAEQCNETWTPCGGGCTATDMTTMFQGVTNFDTTIGDITAWNTSCVTNMRAMFRNAMDFNQDISGWNVSGVTIMRQMFESAQLFNQNLSLWDVSHVTDMWGTFYVAFDFNGNITNWNTSSVTDMGYMFYAANSFAQDISSWDVSHVTNMDWMFDSNYDFNAPIGIWNVSSVTSMQNMFGDASSFNQDIGGWDVSHVTDMSIMFANAFEPTMDFNQDIGGWNTSSVTDMSIMFYHSTSFNQDISGWDVSSVTDMSQMFQGATNFNQSIDSWDVSSVTDMSQMFQGASNFNQNLGAWNTGIVTTMNDMFDGTPLSTSTYNDLLSGWGAKTQQTGIILDAGSTQYTATGQTGRNTLTSTYSWTITDGGFACENDNECGEGLCDGAGSCTNLAAYTIINFTSNGTFNWSGDPINVTVLVIAGGGGGGCSGAGAGGGGAGGIIYQENYLVTDNVSIIIGDGGVGLTCSGYYDFTGENGKETIFGNLTGIGGGGGASGYVNGADGGSGGGGDGGYESTGGTGSQGYNGGQGQHIYGTCSESYAGGGAGGGGGNGGTASSSMCSGGLGGIGFDSNITGSNVCYAGGGAGGNWKGGTNIGGTATCGGGDGGADTSNGENGTDGTGGGGGGAGGGYSGGSTTGGTGGSGMVIISYLTPEAPTECINDSDCGFCAYCNVGVCDNQTVAQDLKDECSASFDACLNPYILQGPNGLCDGGGACDISSGLGNVSSGNVCDSGLDVDPTISINCGNWSDCITGNMSADEYYVGYAGDGTALCVDVDWQPAGTLWNATIGYQINDTEHTDICQEELIPECILDDDCGTCEYCDGGICIFQNSSEDLKDECLSLLTCSNPYTLQNNDGFCDGAGSCSADIFVNVSEGNVCINGTDNNASSSVYCGVWKDCNINQTTAQEYYTGFLGDGGGNCTDINWQAKGTNWTNPYKIIVDENALNCQVDSGVSGTVYASIYDPNPAKEGINLAVSSNITFTPDFVIMAYKINSGSWSNITVTSRTGSNPYKYSSTISGISLHKGDVVYTKWYARDVTSIWHYGDENNVSIIRASSFIDEGYAPNAIQSSSTTNLSVIFTKKPGDIEFNPSVLSLTSQKGSYVKVTNVGDEEFIVSNIYVRDLSFDYPVAARVSLDRTVFSLRPGESLFLLIKPTGIRNIVGSAELIIEGENRTPVAMTINADITVGRIVTDAFSEVADFIVEMFKNIVGA